MMKSIFKEILHLAEPYLNTRRNDVHVEISTRFAYRLMAIEGGNENIVIPAVILHDVGWKKVPPELHLKAFGPKATMPELNRVHELEGVKIAREILEKVNYAIEEITQILEIIDGHDSRKTAISLEDSIVKDADKLWRFTKEGFAIDNERFEEPYDEGLKRLSKYLPVWFFTGTARKLAEEELQKREKDPER